MRQADRGRLAAQPAAGQCNAVSRGRKLRGVAPGGPAVLDFLPCDGRGSPCWALQESMKGRWTADEEPMRRQAVRKSGVDFQGRFIRTPAGYP